MNKTGGLNKLIIFVVLALLVVSSVYAWGLFDSESSYGNGAYTIMGTEEHKISVTGSATVEVEPDMAEIYFYIETLEDTAIESQDVNAEIKDTVIEALDDMGIDEDDIESTSYRLNLDRDWNRNTEEYETNGYEVTHTLKITTYDTEEVGEILDTVVEAGANGISSISFGLSDDLQDDVNQQALANAVEEAKKKAGILANAADVKLGSVINIDENNYYSTPYRYSGYELAMDEAESYSASTVISSGDVETTVSLVIDFAIN